MSSTQELTYSDVSEHKSKKARTLTRLAPFPRRIKSADNFSSPVTQDLYLVIHDKIYNATTFVDEHPGGEEVLLDVGGQDATEAFEDVGHSDEAREILDGLLIGKLQRAENDPAPKLSTGGTSTASTSAQGNAAGLGIGLYALILLGGALAFGAYKYLQANSQKTTL